MMPSHDDRPSDPRMPRWPLNQFASSFTGALFSRFQHAHFAPYPYQRWSAGREPDDESYLVLDGKQRLVVRTREHAVVISLTAARRTVSLTVSGSTDEATTKESLALLDDILRDRRAAVFRRGTLYRFVRASVRPSLDLVVPDPTVIAIRSLHGTCDVGALPKDGPRSGV